MEKAFVDSSHSIGHTAPINSSRGLGWGLIGGLAGTLIMDLVLMGAFAIARLPLLTCFSIVGDTVESIFSIQNTEMSRSIRLGVITHYLIGPLIGAFFGMVIVKVNGLRVNTLKKSILVAILYVEVLSQPLLVVTPILLKMTLPAILLWYGGSFVMHMIAGSVLGMFVGCGLGLNKNNSNHQISP